MLTLQLPQSMQHTSASHRCLHYRPGGAHQSSLTKPLPLHRPSHLDAIKPSRSIFDTAPYNSPLTPPPEMNDSHGGVYSRHGHSSKGTGTSRADSYGNRSQPGTFTTSNQFHTASYGVNKPANRPHSPGWQRSSYNMPDQSQRRKASSNNAIVPYLQIPPSINNSKGSLAEFAAQITCLFWFESSLTLQRVEASEITPLPATPLAHDALPTTGFRKWVTTILSTTQVTQNVILLALLFIYRLKQLNPTVRGKPGSEFRLLTVALMLGNKFLDDNTYTNKTWAEVSGISVQEIHVMEVEFLSNMRYSLYTSEEEWKEWHIKLGRFWDYFDRASRAPPENTSRLAGYGVPTLQIPPPLPSPPASTNASPPFTTSYSPMSSAYATPQSFASYPLPQVSPATVPPLGSLLDFDLRLNGRKRSFDDQAFEPPHKKAALGVHYQQDARSGTSTPISLNGQMPSLPRLPPLNPSLAASQSARDQTNAFSAQLPPFIAPHLPPPGTRSISVAFPPPATWSQPIQNQGAAIPSAHFVANHQLGDHIRRLSPYPTSRGGSPSISTFQQAPPHGQAPQNISPSYFLAQRSSPYRPVRSVNILNVPPLSGSLINPPQMLGHDQMHYQSLGRPMNERKTGLLPYTQYDAWPEPYQNSQWPPYQQQASLRG